VGIHDDFFALGGDSLVGVQMMDAIGKLVGGEVPLTTLFAEPTIARLAIALRNSSPPAIGQRPSHNRSGSARTR
jgi:hypothetical protein